MNAQKELQLRDTYERFMNLMMDDLTLDELNKVAEQDVMGYGTTIDERIFEIEGLRNLVIAQREQGAGMQISYDSKRMHNRISDQEDSALFVDEIKVVIEGNGMKSEIPVRITNLFFYRENTWKLVHWHGSVAVESEEDTWHLNEWKKKTEALEKLVTEKTADLVQKNRELEIEAALERVRARTMAMHHSDELKDAAALLFQQVNALGVPVFSCGYNIWEKGEKEFTAWMTNNDGTGINPAFSLPFTGDANFIRFHESRQQGEEFYVLEMRGERMQEHYRYLIKNIPVFKETFENIRKAGQSLPGTQIHHIVNFSHGNVMFITFELCPEAHDIFRRFAKVFEQTYTRFLDLQKAEAQAREAQIEAALERVRSRTMGMQRSDELAEVATLLFQQVKALGVPQWTCGFCIFEIDDKDFTWFPGGPNDEILPPCKIPLTEHPVFVSFNESRKRGDELFVYEKEGEFQAGHYRYMLSLPIVGDWLQSQLDAGVPFPDFQIDHLANFSHGNLIFVTYEAVPKMYDVFKRFAKVFEQTYTRFLDLQKAEAQAREAKIEAALERVRSRTMAMQKSQELAEVSLTLFEQVEQLGIKTWSTGFNVWLEDDTSYIDWVVNSVSGKFIEPYKVDLTAHPSFMEISSAKKQGDDFFVHETEGETLEELYRLLSQKAKTQFEDIVKAGFQLPEHQFNHYVFGSKVSLMFITFDPCPEAHDIFKRFGKVFEQTYTRFLDLQKAEAQARESQIEAALERVRSRTMAMHHSKELSEVAVLLHQEISALGTTPFLSCGYVEIDHQEKIQRTWMTSIDGSEMEEALLPLTGDPLVDKRYKSWKKQEPIFHQSLADKALANHFEFVIPYFKSKEREILVLNKFPSTVHFYCANFPQGYLHILSGIALTREEEQLLVRFTSVFEMTYKRFLDLKKAEAQAREAQIEAGLERVRSKTMAMHNSQDVGNTVASLFDELVALGLEKSARCGIGILNESDTMELWTASTNENGELILSIGHLNMTLHPLLRGVKKTWSSKKQSFTYELQGEDLINYFNTLNDYPDYHIYIDVKTLPDKIIHNSFYFTDGLIYCFTSNFISEDLAKVVKRFAGVFGQTYKRYLDLQRAEAQAREAQIEASLERVRAHAMGLRKTEELENIIAVIFEELQKLGLELYECSIFLRNGNTREFTVWAKGNSNDTLTHYQFLFVDHPLLNDVLHDLDRKVPYREFSMEADEIRSYGDVIFSQTDLKDAGAEYKEAFYALQKVYAGQAIFQHGFLEAVGTQLLPGDLPEVLKRFSQVIDLTYTRFLDLQKAEAQAREAQIEATMERIRSRALAMRGSEEIMDVITELRRHIDSLGQLDLEASVVHFYPPGEAMFQSIAAVRPPGDSGEIVLANVHFPVDAMERIKYMIEMYESEEAEYTIEFTKEMAEEWQQVMVKYAPMIAERRVGFVNNRRLSDNPEYWNFADFSEGSLLLVTHSPASDDTKTVLRKAAQVFDFAFSRFRDLQKAEARAQEAIKQASLDRVRGVISSMRSAVDLDVITPLIFKELMTLGIPFIRCGVFIIQEKQEIVEAYLSSPDGNSLGVLQLPFDASDLTYKTVEAWRKGVVYRQHWNKEDFVNWINQLMEQDQIQDISTYQGTAAPPESLDLHFVPFTQGMLYVGSENPLDEKELELVQALAKAFSIAYARYEDFVKLERAKAEVESAMNELKATQSQLVQQEKLASLGQLTAGIAHEIKNPLNFVNNFSEVSIELIEEAIEERDKNQETRDETLISEILVDIKSNIQKVHEHGSRANSIVTSMLQHSRGGSGKMEPTDLNALIKEYVNLSYHGMRAGKNPIDVEIALDLDPEIHEVPLIKEDFTRVVINLCNNAFDAMREKLFKTEDRRRKTEDGDSGIVKYDPKLKVTTSLEKSQVRISFEDNGPGIPDEIKDKILQPFFTTKKGTEGTGLGLSITHDIVKAHGGKLEVLSKVDEGTKFIIQLPIQ